MYFLADKCGSLFKTWTEWIGHFCTWTCLSTEWSISLMFAAPATQETLISTSSVRFNPSLKHKLLLLTKHTWTKQPTPIHLRRLYKWKLATKHATHIYQGKSHQQSHAAGGVVQRSIEVLLLLTFHILHLLYFLFFSLITWRCSTSLVLKVGFYFWYCFMSRISQI